MREYASSSSPGIVFIVIPGVLYLNGVPGNLRYPWQLRVFPYLFLMCSWAIAGLWLVLRLGRHWRWNREPHVYGSRSMIILALSIRTDTLEISDIESPFKFQHKKDKLDFYWRAYPPESLRVQARFAIHAGARLVRIATAMYHQPPVPVTVASQLANISYRTKVVVKDTIDVQ